MQNQRKRNFQALGQLDLLRIWTSGMALVLLLATKSLWLPVTTHSFPQIPFFEWLCQIPLTVDWALTVCLCLGLAACCMPCRAYTSPTYTLPTCKFSTIGSWMVLASGIALVALNQHRFQPWFYQLLIFATFFLRARSAESTESAHSATLEQHPVFWLKAIVISIYFYSAMGKFDFEFLHTVGQQFLLVVSRVASLDLNRWEWSSRLWLASLLPLTELLLAVMLGVSLRQSKMFSSVVAIIACIFHLSLMAILGLGLGHSASVILWNLQFAVQAVLLFGLVAKTTASEQLAAREAAERSRSLRGGTMLASGFAVTVMALPLTERWGYWDHWPSWALYAPHSSRVEMYVAAPVITRLPAELQSLMAEDESDDVQALWERIPLAQWSLASLGTPIYPQSRFELGVSRYLAQRVRTKFSVKVVILGTASRLDGRRSSTEVVGTEKIEKAAERFFWNTRPR